VLLLGGGRLLADGPPAQVLTPPLLGLAYGAAFEVVVHPSCRHPIVLPPMLLAPSPVAPAPALTLVARDGAPVG
jgi:iron complex transport system ATP-binding protein